MISCLVGSINGYPLVYPDTGEYLNSGFEAVPPYDRTIFYGLFARHISLFFSLWLVIFAQGILTCYVLFLATDIFFTGRKRNLVFIFAIVILTLTTGFSYNVSIIMPDIFSPISVLCFIILLLHNHLRKYELVIVSLIFVYSIAAQVSSFPIFSLIFTTLGVYILIRKVRKRTLFTEPKRLLLSFSLFLGTFILVPSVHFMLGDNFTLSNGGHVFVMNHLLETGVLKDYLDRSCENKNYKICIYKNNLGNNLMWESEGPLYKTGGWEANKEEYNAIIKDVISEPYYMKTLVKKGIRGSLDQYLTYGVSVAEPQLENTAPYGQIYWRFKREIKNYVSSLQSKGQMGIELINHIQSILIPLSAVLIFLLVALNSFSKKTPTSLLWAIIMVFTYSVISAVICANFSTIDARYQNRIVWLFPFLALLFVVKWIEMSAKPGNQRV